MVDISTGVVDQQATEEKVEQSIEEKIEQPAETKELVQEIIDYVMRTPHNTNPNILRQMLIILQNGEKNSQ
jgi:hypothetical protein